jgi:DMSO reductase anchor subunit
MHYEEIDGTIALGAAGVAVTIVLFICTAMIYACIRFLQEWAHPLTVINFTREFFHGRTASLVRAVLSVFLVCVFAVPVVLLLAAARWDVAAFAIAAFVVQYAGLIAERWHFLAGARHPQNLYYQTIS